MKLKDINDQFYPYQIVLPENNFELQILWKLITNSSDEIKLPHNFTLEDNQKILIRFKYTKMLDGYLSTDIDVYNTDKLGNLVSLSAKHIEGKTYVTVNHEDEISILFKENS